MTMAAKMIPQPHLIFGSWALFLLRLAVLTRLTASESSPAKWKKWCGKNYELGAPVEPPGGKFESSSSWAIRCTPVLQPSIEPEPIFLIVDLAAGGQTKLELADSETGRILFSGPARSRLKIGPLKVGSARLKPYQINCRTPIGSHSFQLSYLPRSGTRIVQRDAESGFFRISGEGFSKPFFPFGFYTSFGGYMDSPELSAIIADMKDRRVNTVHLVSGGSNMSEVTAASKVFKSLDKAGLWFQYDMRHSYQNLTQVAQEVKVMAHQQNLLSYYTADEPDGTGDPLQGPELTHSHLRDIDPYHPVALTLNCADFHFSEYTDGTEIIMTDPYFIAMKSTEFSKWGTSCNTTYGDCGCDNCEGNFLDITRRMVSFRDRRQKLGRSRSMQIWGVPQAFKDDSYWTRQSTYEEFLLSCSLYVIEGAVGLMGWLENHDVSLEIKRATKVFGEALEKMMDYLALPNLYLEQPVSSDSQRTIRSRLWTDPKTNFTLIIIANLINLAQPWSLMSEAQNLSKKQTVEEIYSSNVSKSPQVEKTGRVVGELGGLGCSAIIIHTQL